MLPFVFGALSVAVLFAVARGVRRRRWRRWRGGMGRRRGGWMIDRLVRRLGARPEQEAEIEGALRDLMAELDRHREAFATLRGELALAVTAESLEGPALEGVVGHVDRVTGEVRDAGRRALGRLHGVLDPEQRQRLAEILRDGLWRHHARHAPHPVQL